MSERLEAERPDLVTLRVTEGAEHVQSELSEDERHQRGLDAFADLKALLGTTD